MVGRLSRRSALRPAISRRHVDFAAEDRVDPALSRLIVKHDRREHVSVFGDGRGRHAELDAAVEQLLDPARAVEQRELRVQVKVDEIAHSHSIVDGGFELMS